MRRWALALALAFVVARPAAAVELEGFWYVLVHYQDSESNKPEQWRWDDRVWKFTKKGERLEWTEYPIVQFGDDSGRFEPMRGGRAARVLGKWEPSAAQLADIRDGLAANTRGVKTKTLRAENGGTAWSSGAGAGAESAMVITYSETWSIKGLPEAPEFARDDSMGSAATESMSGRTVYRTESVSENGDLLEGSYERDGTRTGRFRLMRSAEVGSVGTRTQQERQREAFDRSMETASDAEIAQLFGGQIELPAEAKQADRTKARSVIRGSVEETIRRSGNDPAGAGTLIDRMSRQIERALFDEDKSVEQVRELLATGQLGQ